MALGKKTGGRKAGTPNKVSGDVRKLISKIVTGYYESGQLETDLALMKPCDRVNAVEKMTSYVLPKLQQTTLDANVEVDKTIEDKLKALSGD